LDVDESCGSSKEEKAEVAGASSHLGLLGMFDFFKNRKNVSVYSSVHERSDEN
jgi:hypothetical protein